MNEVLNHQFINMPTGGVQNVQAPMQQQPFIQAQSQQFLPPIQRGWSGKQPQLGEGAAGQRH